MWRNYVICVLIGLLLVSSGSSVVLLRQVIVSALLVLALGL